MKKILSGLLVVLALLLLGNSTLACSDCEKADIKCNCQKECPKDCDCDCHKGVKCEKENCDCNGHKKCDKSCDCGCQKKFRFFKKKQIKCNCEE